MIGFINGGFNEIHPGSYKMRRPGGISNFVMLIVRSEARFNIDGVIYYIKPPKVVVFAPNTAYEYFNPKGNYIDDWIHFTVSEKNIVESLLQISNTPFDINESNTCLNFIKQILWEASYNKSQYTDENIDLLFRLLFNHLYYAFMYRFDNKFTLEKDLKKVRLNIESSLYKDISAEEIAKELNISKSYFQNIYKKYFGISFRKDVITIRIDRAKYLLSSSELSVKEISQACGYTSDVHFFRQFKQIVGKTPLEYKKEV